MGPSQQQDSNSKIIQYLQLIIILPMHINQQQQINLKEQSAPKPATFTDSKKQYELVFKLVYLTATIFSAVLLRKVYMFQTMPQFDDARKGTVADFLYYSLPFGILFTAFDLGVHYVFDGLCEKYYLTQKKYEGKARAKRSYTLVKWAYSLVYYFISSIASVYLLKDTTFFPTWLGGNGSCSNQFLNAPFLPEATTEMKIFYLLQFGKHASRLFSHMFIRQEGNYYQYVLHHSLSTFLILFSYLTNQWLIGIMVLFCHDVSDFFLIIGRGYKDYKNCSKTVLQTIYVLAIGSWVIGRLVIFPACCVYQAVFGPSRISESLTEVQRDVLIFPYQWMGFMLAGLLLLQVFWTYYIAKAFISVNVLEKIASNTYQ